MRFSSSGGKVVAKQVAAVVGRVQLLGARSPVEADGVAQAGGVELLAAAIQPISYDRGATWVRLDARVAARAHGHVEHPVRTDAYRARPVVAAGREVGDDTCEWTAGRPRVRIEPDAPDGARLRHPEPAVVDIQAVRPVETAQQDHTAVRLAIAVAVALEQRDLALPRLAEQEIARGGEA